MTVILEFRQQSGTVPAVESRPRRRDPERRGEVIIFPGVRIERETAETDGAEDKSDGAVD